MKAPLIAAARQTAEKWKSNIKDAVAYCLLDLPDALAARKAHKGEPRSLPAWMEAGPELLEHLLKAMQTAQGELRVATQMSNIGRINLASKPQSASVQDTRTLQSALVGHPNSILEALNRLEAEHLVAWAPKDAGQTQKIATTWRLHASEFRRLRKISLLVPFVGLPHMRSAADIMDVWTHPLLHEKWKDVVSEVQFLATPAPIIMSGETAPLHAQRHIAIFTLGNCGHGTVAAHTLRGADTGNPRRKRRPRSKVEGSQTA